ncbi:MAG: hypothetical protein JXA54_00075 [Candidatus Heimdallarchaeota archaeon]|nr:hypothetical protein [Candidatus Heimdallarchaeota archaeon]
MKNKIKLFSNPSIFLIIFVIISPYVFLGESVTYNDSENDVLYFLDGEYIKIVREFDEIDILSIEISVDHVRLNVAAEITFIVERAYEVLIYWDDIVTRDTSLTKNNTRCYLDSYGPYSITKTYNSTGHLLSITSGNYCFWNAYVLWEINTSYLTSPLSPATVFAYTYNKKITMSATTLLLEEWCDFYPNNSHTFDLETLNIKIPFFFIASIMTISLYTIKRKFNK